MNGNPATGAIFTHTSTPANNPPPTPTYPS